MSRSLTLTVPNEVFDSLDAQARASGQTVHDLVLSVLTLRTLSEPPHRNGAGTSAAGLSRLLEHCGRVAVDDPSGADNEAIDRDLAREYESTHEA